MIRFSSIWRGCLKALAIGAALVAALPVQAQTSDPISGNATVLRLQNEYLTLVYGQSGTPAVAALAAPDTNLSGRWGIATIGGDPTTTDDDNRLVSAWNFLSYQVEPQLEAQSTKWYRLGNSSDGSYSIGPLMDSEARFIRSEWNTSGTISVPVSGQSSTTNQSQEVGIKITEKLSLIRDLVRVEYTFENTCGYQRRVRARIFENPADNGSWIIGKQRVQYETEYTGGNIPEEWREYCSLDDPELTVRGILSKYGATAPNRFVVGTASSLANSAWNYNVNSSVRLDATPDSIDEACQSYYDTFSLLPGQKRTIVTYAGLGVAESDPTVPYDLAVQAPRSIGYVQGDDPSTSETEPSYPSPRTFNITAYVYNVAEYDMSNVKLFLTLPKGITLSAGESATKSVGTVLKQEEGSASWKVQVASDACGNLEYTVTSSGTPVTSKTVRVIVEVPAQATHTYNAGLYLMSVPFQFANADTAVALNLSSDRIHMARWSSSKKKYEFYPDSNVSTVQTGAGYWFKPDTNTTIVLQNATPVSRTTSANYIIPIHAGWNMIGCPYVYAVPWGNTRVSDGTTVYSLEEATRAGWIRPTLFSYNSTAASYEYDTVANTMLEPWMGYWLRADRDAFLIVPPVSSPGANLEAPDQQRSAKEGWKIQLVARTAGAADACNYAGISRSVTDGYGIEDIEEPPAPGSGYVSLRFLHNDWGAHNGRYTEDMRGDEFAGDKVWNIEVATDKVGQDITLTWPQLNARLPRNYSATLEDVSTGRKVYLRTQGSYVYKATDTTARQFRLTVSRRSAAPLSITAIDVSSVSGRAAARSINYQLSGDAVATVRIISPTGRVLQKVADAVVAGAGRNSAIWDGCDSRGVRLTSGIVLIEITATSNEGNTVRAMRPCVLTR